MFHALSDLDLTEEDLGLVMKNYLWVKLCKLVVVVCQLLVGFHELMGVSSTLRNGNACGLQVLALMDLLRRASQRWRDTL